jgi:hypothetical protein
MKMMRACKSAEHGGGAEADDEENADVLRQTQSVTIFLYYSGEQNLLREAVSVVERINVRALQPVGCDDKDVDENKVVLEQLELRCSGHIGGLRKLFAEKESHCKEEDEPQSKVRVEREDGRH